MLTLAKLIRLAQQALDADDTAETSAELHAWATANAPELARAMAREDDAMRDALLRCAPCDFARNLLGSCQSKGVREAVRARDAQDARGEVDEATARAAAGAVRLNDTTWSVDADAIVALAGVLGRADDRFVAFDGPDGSTTLVRASLLSNIARANGKRTLTFEFLAGASVLARRGKVTCLSVHAGGARGYRLCGPTMAGYEIRREVGLGHIALVTLPAELPCEATAYDGAAE